MRGRKPDAITASTSPVNEVPRPPVWLCKAGKAEWKRVAPILSVERRTLDLADLATLANYCVAVGQVIEARRIIAREGMTYKGAAGPKKHPAVGILNDGMTQARQLAAELGLTPVSRSRSAIRDGADGDDLGFLG